MSLNKPQLVEDLGSLYDDTLASTGNQADAKQAFVNRLADIIDGYVKSAHINYEGGLSAGTNVVVGTINHTIS